MRLHNTPIKRKLTLVILLTSGVALFLAYVAFVAVELISSRGSMVRDLQILADVAAINTTAALSFQNPSDATEVLNALSAEPQILGAWLYEENGSLFASYHKNVGPVGLDAKIPPEFSSLNHGNPGEGTSAKSSSDHSFTGKYLLLCRPIMLNQRYLGSICLQASLGELYSRLRLYAGIVLLSLVGSLMGAFAISSSLRRSVADPILGLASTARLIASNGNYSLRVLKQSNDEIGLFTDDFNQMLAAIEERESALHKGTLELKEQIGARIQAEEKLKSLNEELELRVTERTQELMRSNEELEQFAYVASHDLQEPLRMVGSYMQIIESRYQGKLDADADKFIGFAVDGAKRMQALIRGLLAYSRVGARGKRTEAACCEELIQSAIADLKLAAEECGAIITHDPLPTINADPTQIVQLFQNLLSNALKFHGKEPPRVHVSASRSDRVWTFSIKDNGIGIDPTFFERIFIIFQRLHARKEYPGTGIGLAVCKKIIERHGGKIWVESEPGQGTTFFFTIPA